MDPRSRLRRMPAMQFGEWLDAQGGIVHRSVALEAGYSVPLLRASIAVGAIRRVRRYWLATDAAPPELITAAQATGLLACVSAARHRGWWIPDAAPHDSRTHIRVGPHAESPAGDVAVHWSKAIVPVGRSELVESVEDTLQHVAECLDHESALVVWESAAGLERLGREYLRRVNWTSDAAMQIAEQIDGLADSGLETLFVSKVRRWGVAVRQQVLIAGHRVDALVGDRLVAQIDGFAHHSSAADRQRDVAHDAELVARGYAVLRFTYAQVVHDWPAVSRMLRRAIATGLHTW